MRFWNQRYMCLVPGTLLSVGLLSLASCASAPAIQKSGIEESVPSQWSTGTSAVSADSALVGWWSQFQDPALDSLVVGALKHNFNLKAAAVRVTAAKAQARVAGAPLYPQVNLNFNNSKRRQNFIGFPIPGRAGGGGVLSTTATTYGLSGDLSWELDLWRRIGAGKAAALADVQASQADYRGAQLSLAAQTSKAWFASIEAGRQLDLAEATLENFRVINDRIRNRYVRGLRPPLDLRLSLTNVATAEALVAQRRQNVDASIRQLEILLGRYPGAEIEVFPDLPPVPSQVPEGLPADLISRRPDLVLAERQVAASGARVSEAKRARYPRITLTGSSGTSSRSLSGLLNGDFFVWSLAGGVLTPLFQGGRLKAGVSLAEANHEQAVASFAEQALRAYGEVESALAADAFLTERERALREATFQSDAARQQAESRYASGLSDVVTMLEAQRRALDAEGQYITVRRQRLDTRVDLYLALGGGFE